MIDKPGQISAESGQGGVSRPNPSKSRPDLTPSEIIRLGIEATQPADVILASLEAAGWVCVPIEPTEVMVEAGAPVVYDCFSLEPGEGLDENPAVPTWQAMIAARPK